MNEIFAHEWEDWKPYDEKKLNRKLRYRFLFKVSSHLETRLSAFIQVTCIMKYSHPSPFNEQSNNEYFSLKLHVVHFSYNLPSLLLKIKEKSYFLTSIFQNRRNQTNSGDANLANSGGIEGKKSIIVAGWYQKSNWS